MDISVVKLIDDNNYAIISPDRIVFGLNASQQEIKNLIESEKEYWHYKSKKEINSVNIAQQENAKVVLMLTFDCNLRCIYCYSRGGETKESLEINKMISVIDSEKKESNSDYLDFYLVGGGEPFLKIIEIKKIVSYAERYFKTVVIHVVTNGTFDDSTLEWLINRGKNNHVRISYDGVMQNIHRPRADGSPSSSIVEKNIKALVANKVPVIVQCIVTNLSLDSMRNTISKIADMGIDVIKIEPALATDVSRANKDLSPNPTKYASMLNNIIMFVANSGMSLKIDTGFFTRPATGYYCGISSGNKIITPHGLVTSCVEVARPNDPYAESIIYGEVKTNRLKIERLKLDILKSLHFKNYKGGCFSCNLRYLCLGGCPMSNIWQNGFPLKKSRYTCIIEHSLLPTLLFNIATNSKIADIVLDNARVLSC